MIVVDVCGKILGKRAEYFRADGRQVAEWAVFE